MTEELYNRQNPYIAVIKYSFREIKEEKRFKTKEDRERYLDSMADDIDSVRLFCSTGKLIKHEFSWEEELKSDSWSDAHAEALLFELRRK